jgi:hypothetical protein
MMTVDPLAKASRLADEIRCVMRLVAAYPSAAHPECAAHSLTRLRAWPLFQYPELFVSHVRIFLEQ